MHSSAAAAATAGARLTPCTWLVGLPHMERISAMCTTCAAWRTLPQCTTGVYAVLQEQISKLASQEPCILSGEILHLFISCSA